MYALRMGLLAAFTNLYQIQKRKFVFVSFFRCLSISTCAVFCAVVFIHSLDFSPHILPKKQKKRNWKMKNYNAKREKDWFIINDIINKISPCRKRNWSFKSIYKFAISYFSLFFLVASLWSRELSPFYSELEWKSLYLVISYYSVLHQKQVNTYFI
jgi:hypothetical protein